MPLLTSIAHTDSQMTLAHCQLDDLNQIRANERLELCSTVLQPPSSASVSGSWSQIQTLESRLQVALDERDRAIEERDELRVTDHCRQWLGADWFNRLILVKRNGA